MSSTRYSMSGIRFARLALVTVSAAALATIAACGQDGGGPPLTRGVVKVESHTQQGGCEDVNIKVTPLEILPGAPKLSNSKEFVTPVKLTKGADNLTCTGQADTIPMAPGKWKLTANLPSDVASCERDVAAGAKPEFVFKDGESTCSDGSAPAAAAPAAPAADAAAPAAPAKP
jgi:hypothetical protein